MFNKFFDKTNNPQPDYELDKEGRIEVITSLVKNLTKQEFNELMRSADLIWQAYNGEPDVGQSGGGEKPRKPLQPKTTAPTTTVKVLERDRAVNNTSTIKTKGIINDFLPTPIKVAGGVA